MVIIIKLGVLEGTQVGRGGEFQGIPLCMKHGRDIEFPGGISYPRKFGTPAKKIMSLQEMMGYRISRGYI